MVFAFSMTFCAQSPVPVRKSHDLTSQRCDFAKLDIFIFTDLQGVSLSLLAQNRSSMAEESNPSREIDVHSADAASPDAAISKPIARMPWRLRTTEHTLPRA